MLLLGAADPLEYWAVQCTASYVARFPQMHLHISLQCTQGEGVKEN